MDIEVLVIGAGVVGLAVAAELSRNHSVLVVERHESFARETSSHNSGVIHSGIYYPTGSWKHRLCLEGNRALYAWCAIRRVPHRRIGKLIVATTPDETVRLDELEALARTNGVPELRRLSGEQALAEEPSVPATSALYSGSTGIVDQMALARSLEAEARRAGTQFVYRHGFVAGERSPSMFHVKLLDADGTASEMSAGAIVNAAGHGTPQVAAALGYPLDGDAARSIPPVRQRPNRGRYYDVTNPAIARSVRHLVYPAPPRGSAGLGVHITLDLDGGMHLGPDAEEMAESEPLTYRNDDSRRRAFLASAQKLLPTLEDADIAPGQVGYRPRLDREGVEPPDFGLWHDRGYVHLGGIESPGLTAAIPIARIVADMLR